MQHYAWVYTHGQDSKTSTMPPSNSSKSETWLRPRIPTTAENELHKTSAIQFGYLPTRRNLNGKVKDSIIKREVRDQRSILLLLACMTSIYVSVPRTSELENNKLTLQLINNKNIGPQISYKYVRCDANFLADLKNL